MKPEKRNELRELCISNEYTFQDASDAITALLDALEEQIIRAEAAERDRDYHKAWREAVERLQEISEGDAKAEGVSATAAKFGGCQARDKPDRDSGKFGCPKGCNCFNARENFEGLWNSLHAKRGFDWHSNPYVWVISFERVTA